MGDEEHRQVEVVLEVTQEVDDLSLNRDVECGNGLVRDDEVRVHGERPGDPDALPLSA